MEFWHWRLIHSRPIPFKNNIPSPLRARLLINSGILVSRIINIENVYFSYSNEKKWALENISLSVKRGEFLVVMGETGAGKTTFCKLINGIVPQLSGGRFLGTVTVDGESTTEVPVPRLALNVGMTFDDPDAQLFTSSVRHEAAFGPENLLLPPLEIERRVNLALEAVGLSGFEERSPMTLSGGEKQRLAIAAALAMAGKILVLDEPQARLDPQGAAEVMSVIGEIRRKYQITVIMATNSSKRVCEFADRVCILKNGSIAALDTAQAIVSNRRLLDENGIEPPAEPDIFSVFPLDKGERGNKTGTPSVEISGFYHKYADSGAGIENINLSVADNDFIAITGHNGCGKTTLLKNIAGLIRPAAGDIFIRGKNSKELTVSAISKEVGFVMQNPETQLFTDSVYREVSFSLERAGLPKAEIKSRVEEALRIVELDNPGAFPHALRRADRTKAVIACILAMGCKIIIFDEVDIGQDYKGSIKIMNIAKDLHSRGFTIIFVTHNISLVCKYAHRLVKMDRKGIIMDRRRRDNQHEK